MNLFLSRFPSLKTISHNPIIFFTSSRYLSYAIQFARGLLVANFLGTSLFGVWGFLTLLQLYLSYTNFGLQYAINVDLATSELDEERERKIIGSTLASTIFIAMLLVLIGASIQFADIPTGSKYNIGQFTLYLGVLAGGNHVNEVLKNIFRVKQRLNRIAFGELITGILPLLAVLLSPKSLLIDALLVSLIVSTLISIIIFVISPPFKISFQFHFQTAKHLFAIGLPLLIYNVSFNLITTAARTLIGAFYSVETMGYYTLANTITNAVLLGLKAIAWVFLPQILAQTKESIENIKVERTVKKVNDLYGTSVFLAVFATIMSLPLLFLYLPEYRPVETVLVILLLSQALSSLSFGYNAVAIARKKQMQIAVISIFAVGIVAILGGFFVFLDLSFEWIALAVFIGTVIFTLLQANLGTKVIGIQGAKMPIVEVVSFGTIVAIGLFFVGTLVGRTFLCGLVAIPIFIFSNQAKVRYIFEFLREKAKAV